MNKTKLWIMLLGLSLLYSLPGVGMLSAQTNNMPLLCTMYGEFNGARLGHSLASLDFNGDGIKDLVALESLWNPYGVLDSQYDNFGRINFYWGGADIDANLDASISGDAWEYVGGTLVAVGDINNDGKEDLACLTTRSLITKLRIFFGRSEPSPIPDYELSYANPGQIWELFVRPVGDINSDGYDDVGIHVKWRYTNPEFLILDGSTMNLIQAGTQMQTAYSGFIGGIGDVNGDGYDDYLISRILQPTGGLHNRITIFFGGESIPPSDSLVIVEDTNMVIETFVGPLGDLNGDGIDDFVGWIGGDGFRIWYGSSALTPQCDQLIPSAGYTYNARCYALVHGDFNGDGYSDMISSDYTYGSDGSAFMWLGGANMNSTYDLRFFAPTSISEKFGWDKVAGDFNNDGFCDVAISQPWADPDPLRTPGRVHVYLGNAGLTDTTVSNQDDVLPPINEASNWDVMISPNPVSVNNQDISIHFIGQGYKELPCARIEVFNLRGQLISDFVVDRASLASGQYSIQLHDLNSGLYFLKIADQHGSVASRKFILK
ncbi:MAG TPA: FG-GAP-like repeat-containing protein [Candidatus Cloacimonadota bacterium]|nr:FG-GAP-like repeat-containing protein [Candidatus Cloacimonadota bacterium]